MTSWVRPANGAPERRRIGVVDFFCGAGGVSAGLKGVEGPAEFVAAANAHGDGSDHPVFVCLDEMNLARVEYYFAEALSAMESGSDIVLDTRGDISVPSVIGWPPNLYVFGTVNIDETTLRISDKVLDRAQVIDTSDIDLLPVLDQWLTESTHLTDEERARIRDIVGQAWTILRPLDAHFGYRTTRAILRFIDQAKASSEGHLPVDAAIDSQIVQKVLVKLRGEGERWATPLSQLEELFGHLSGANRARGAITRMRADLERLGSFQFWN